MLGEEYVWQKKRSTILWLYVDDLVIVKKSAQSSLLERLPKTIRVWVGERSPTSSEDIVKCIDIYLNHHNLDEEPKSLGLLTRNTTIQEILDEDWGTDYWYKKDFISVTHIRDHLL